MATKAKTRTRARTAPVAEAPKPTPQTAAPEPAPAVVEPVGLRTEVGWNPIDKNPRPVGPLTKTATLIRGTSWTLSYSNGPIFLANGKAVPVTECEFERLAEAIDRVDFPDPSSGVRIERAIRKFIFHDTTTGKLVEMPAIPDKEVGPLALSLGDQAQRDRMFEGAEHTSR